MLDESARASGDGTPTAVIATLSAQRKCEAFIPWRQGYTPREHGDLWDEQRRVAREAERDREMTELLRQQHRRELRVMGGIVTVTLVLATIGAAILQGAISQGWQPEWWPF